MPTKSEAKPIIEQSIKKLEKWIEDNDYKGFHPADGLTSPLRSLTFGNFFLELLLIQLVWKSPFNLRPLLGIKPLRNNIGMGYIAWGYLTMFKITDDENYKRKAEECLEWLINNKAPGFNNYCWGKVIDYTSRAGRVGKFIPTTVWTSLIGHTFLDAYEIFGDKKYFAVAKSICDWILGMPRNQTDSGACINYDPVTKGKCTIHNQSMLAASMLSRTAGYNHNTQYLTLAKEAITFSCTRQRPDGSWFYAETPTYHWIDSFHTAYNLDALKCYIENTGDKTFEENLKKGFNFFRNNFFESDGKPKYYHNRLYVVDSQCASQAIETLANFSDYDKTSLDDAIMVALWTIQNMQDPTGYFYYRKYTFNTMKVPMIHWAQGTTYRALSLLLLKLKSSQNRGNFTI